MINLSDDTCINISVLVVLILIFFKVVTSFNKNENFAVGDRVSDIIKVKTKKGGKKGGKKGSKKGSKKSSDSTDSSEDSELKEHKKYGEKYTHLGCFRDTATRMVPTLENTDSRLDGGYQQRADAIEKCYNVAKDRGMKIFGLQHGGWCAGDFHMHSYDILGSPGQNNGPLSGYPASQCANGKGGAWANDVYKINY